MNQENCLQSIIDQKRLQISVAKNQLSLTDLQEKISNARPTRSLKQYLAEKASQDFFVIAEFKRSSPSRGAINLNADLAAVLLSYQQAGAAAVSVLTENHRFGGSLADLQQAKDVLNIPILRKDFIIDPYQIIEARAHGADLILLIAEALTPQEISEYIEIAHENQLEVLLEFHEQSELDMVLTQQADFLGVNNRNLKTLDSNWQHSLTVANNFKSNKLKLSESAIDSPEKVITLIKAGYQGFLIGEYFMKQENPGAACAELIAEVRMRANV